MKSALVTWACTVASVVSIILSGCSASFTAYNKDIFEGKKELEAGSFAPAREDFARAVKIKESSESLAFAATASYRLGDLAAAEGYLSAAERFKTHGPYYLRILGYKALVLLAEGKQTDGLAALRRYVDAFKATYDMDAIVQVEGMVSTEEVNLPRLTRLIEQQASALESDWEQSERSGTGYFANKVDPLYLD